MLSVVLVSKQHFITSISVAEPPLNGQWPLYLMQTRNCAKSIKAMRYSASSSLLLSQREFTFHFNAQHSHSFRFTLSSIAAIHHNCNVFYCCLTAEHELLKTSYWFLNGSVLTLHVASCQETWKVSSKKKRLKANRSHQTNMRALHPFCKLANQYQLFPLTGLVMI